MPKLRVHNLAMSVDGYVAGPGQDLDHPLGVGGERLHEWAFATPSFRRMHGLEAGEVADGSGDVDDRFIARGDDGRSSTRQIRSDPLTATTSACPSATEDPSATEHPSDTSVDTSVRGKVR